MKKKWWIIIVLGVLVLGVCVGLLWEPAAVRAAPNLVLTRDIQDTVEDLEERFGDSPLRIISSALNKNGCQNITLQLDTGNAVLGALRYNMNVQTQGSPLKVFAEGTVTVGGKSVDLSVFLDGNFAAVSSKELLSGNFYGITYDSFSSDIRSNQLLAYMIGNDTISTWEDGVGKLQQTMSTNITIPNFSADDLEMATLGLLVLKADVTSQILTVSGVEEKVSTVLYHATGEQIGQAVGEFRSQLPSDLQKWITALEKDPNASVALAFSLLDGSVVQAQGQLETSDGHYRVLAQLGKDALSDPISLSFSSQQEGMTRRYDLRMDPIPAENAYSERITLSKTINGVQDAVVIDYSRDNTTGEIYANVYQNNSRTDLRMNLQPCEGGFTLSTSDFAALMGLITGIEFDSAAICTMAVTEGTGVTTPDYRSFSQWSVEDLVTLLDGFGSLLGLNLP